MEIRILVNQMYVTKLKNVQRVMHKFLLAYGDDTYHKSQHIDHSKDRHYLYIKYGGLLYQVNNPFLDPNLVYVKNEQYQMNLL